MNGKVLISTLEVIRSSPKIMPSTPLPPRRHDD